MDKCRFLLNGCGRKLPMWWKEMPKRLGVDSVGTFSTFYLEFLSELLEDDFLPNSNNKFKYFKRNEIASLPPFLK